MPSILLAKSPQFITYNSDLNYTFIKVYLYLWQGLFADIPSSATHTYTVYRTSTATKVTYVDVQQPILELLNPRPNSSYFTASTTTDFGEFVNVKYTIDVFVDTSELIDNVDSTFMLATHGYGNYSNGSNPKLKIIPNPDVITSDSDLITIDSTLFTIDMDGKKILFENKYKYHAPNARVFDGFLNQDTTGSNDIISRELTSDFILSCPGKYAPKQVMYMDKNGLFDTFSFTRATSESVKSTIEVSNRLNPTPYDYNKYDHNQKVTKIGTVKWTFNTDNLSEINGEYLKDLFFSDIYYLIDYQTETFIPLILTDTDFVPKTAMNERGKQQYTFKFQEANEYVQKIR